MRKLKIGLIGCGTIGTGIAKGLSSKLTTKARLSYVADSDKSKADALKKRCRSKARHVSIEELVSHSDIIIDSSVSLMSIRI